MEKNNNNKKAIVKKVYDDSWMDINKWKSPLVLSVLLGTVSVASFAVGVAFQQAPIVENYAETLAEPQGYTEYIAEEINEQNKIYTKMLFDGEISFRDYEQLVKEYKPTKASDYIKEFGDESSKQKLTEHINKTNTISNVSFAVSGATVLSTLGFAIAGDVKYKQQKKAQEERARNRLLEKNGRNNINYDDYPADYTPTKPSFVSDSKKREEIEEYYKHIDF